MQLYELIEGTSPLIISIPHAGEFIPEDIVSRLTDKAKDIPDTDWYVDRLYRFAEKENATIIKSNYSRYVIDLNRNPSDVSLYPGQFATSLCPVRTFEDKPVYLHEEALEQDEVDHRIERYWWPYHQEIQRQINRSLNKHGFVVLLDAHSIASVVPTLFDGQLPDFNLGTNDGQSCADSLTSTLDTLDFSPYTKIVNGRFKGGYITRHYGQPDKHVHTVQLELSQAAYMDEDNSSWSEDKHGLVSARLKHLVHTLQNWCNDQPVGI